MNFESIIIDNIDTGYSINISGTVKNKKGNILKPAKDSDGYLRIGLFINKKQNFFRVHRLVFATFHGHMPEVVNHIDGNRENNNICNLQGTDNNLNTWHGKEKSRTGNQIPRDKETINSQIVALHLSGMIQKDIAEKLNISQSHISNHLIKSGHKQRSKINLDKVKKVKSTAKENPGISLRKLAKLTNTSHQLIKQIMKDEKF